MSPMFLPLRTSDAGAGETHSLAIAHGGAVLAWGSNAGGQLGDGTVTTRLNPVQVAGLGPGSKVVAVAGGRFFSLALEADGTVLAWGTGALGVSPPTTRLTPVQTTDLGPGSKVIAIAAGLSHALALKSDGTVLSWGSNQLGQLGNESTTPNKPVPVTGLGPGSKVIAIAASGTVSAALKSDGTVVAWGNNSFGQLGNGTVDPARTPVQVNGLGTGSGVIAIATGAFSLALKSDGSVFGWGNNAFGSVGDGTDVERQLSPVPVSGLTAGSGVIAIAGGGGGSHALALRSDGTVLAWGGNSAGQLGDGTTTNRRVPTAVRELAKVVAIGVGASHSLARRTDGTLFAWGSNGSGQLGDGTFQGSRTFVGAGQLGAGSETSVSAGATHCLAVRSDGAVLAWGSNGNGQLGNATIASSFAPVPVSGLGAGSGVTAVSCGVGGVGGGHSLALRKSDGTVFAWGANTNGQLGDGTGAQQETPVQVIGPGAASRVTAIAAGGLSFSLALKEDGTVLAWGTNNNGQLGDDTLLDRPAPVQVKGLGPGSGVIRIAAGNHGLALKGDGTVLAWGGNNNGQLGIGSNQQQKVPVQVSGLGPGSGVIAIEAAATHSLALKSDGKVLAWGANTSGQLGDGTTLPSLKPVEVSTLEGKFVTAISIDRLNGGSSFATLADGTVLGFGSNATGQLGDGTFETRGDARQVGPFGPGSGVKAVRAGTGFALVLGSNGAVSAVGTDAFGQLGDGPNPTKNQTPSPVLAVVAA